MSASDQSGAVTTLQHSCHLWILFSLDSKHPFLLYSVYVYRTGPNLSHVHYNHMHMYISMKLIRMDDVHVHSCTLELGYAFLLYVYTVHNLTSAMHVCASCTYIYTCMSISMIFVYFGCVCNPINTSTCTHTIIPWVMI